VAARIARPRGPWSRAGRHAKYAPGFRSFDYANPDAPVGGEVRMSAMGTFDKLNPFTLEGLAPAFLSSLVFETLAAGSLDEPYAMYGLLAGHVTGAGRIVDHLPAQPPCPLLQRRCGDGR
jgi:ABC-type oligopeptide transport system substrate-binding subunit